MSLGRCIPDMVKRGEIDAARGKRMKDLFDDLETFYGKSMGPDAAAAEASEATLRQLRAEARLKKRQTLLQINRQREAVQDVARFRGKSRYAAVSALLDDDDRAPYRGGNVTTAAQRIEFQMHGRIGEFIERHRNTLLGKPDDPQGLDDVARELAGQASGNERARVFAESLRDTFETLRQRFNSAGGNIRKLDSYALPHRHDALKVRAASKAQWLADITPELDRAKMIDDRTGAPLSDERLAEVLDGIHDTIRTAGLNGEPSTAFRGPGKVASRRAEHRVLHFRDGDAWLRYNAKYGADHSVFNAIMGHIRGMSKDIALMERLGPNPDATVRYLLDAADIAEAKGNDVLVGAVESKSAGRKRAEDLWRYVKGETSVPVVPESVIGRGVLAGTYGARNWNVASMLGSAMISAMSDTHTGVLARKFYGLPDTRALSYYLRQFVPRSKESRDLATRLGAGMHQAAQGMTSTVRLFGEARGPAWTQVMADSTLRVSGLSLWTEKGQEMFVTDLLGALGDVRDRPWDNLPAGMRAAMERNGIDKFDWTAIRQSEPIRTASGTYIDPQAVMDRKAGERLADMVLRGRAAAVIDTSPTSRVAVNFGTTPGTLGGEVIRNSFQFKGFAGALAIKQYRMTMFGALTIQLREIAKGRDPRPMDDWEFWSDALLQGGGLGIAGDLIGVFSNDRIDSVGQFFGGPNVALVTDAVRGVKTALPGKEREDGTYREGNPGKAALRFAKRHLPGTNLWYARLAFERLIIDTLDEQVNPDVELDRARQQRTAEKNHQGFWWAPGSMAPERAPN